MSDTKPMLWIAIDFDLDRTSIVQKLDDGAIGVERVELLASGSAYSESLTDGIHGRVYTSRSTLLRKERQGIAHTKNGVLYGFFFVNAKQVADLLNNDEFKTTVTWRGLVMKPNAAAQQRRKAKKRSTKK